ncbi:formylglycine-generating enzyme family protein [Jiella sonneratiae]|uniref:Formylglycine-generating enzyme family protein n=1 Tax=Jiella sonneratiae TaxID=2816856 RepID=A0ABS3J568_9HYPH|nr:formylglycine-generating enzyme family protein [Jiella sonneratiae]MBO0904819.1 formylglycine-generating enzyme family protein [Jiella sonneratiae]
MTCCGDRTRAGSKPGNAAPGRAAGPATRSAAIADATPCERVRFEGGPSHVGTFRPEIVADGEGIVRKVRLQPFLVDAVPVTNARFAAFVAATGYVTESERFGWGPVFSGLLPEAERIASPGPAPWWTARDGACWHAPEGAESDVAERAGHPVVHVSLADAQAFAVWAGGRLPSEAEWEHAARGGLEGDPRFPWGDREPDDRDFTPANIWQGRFPDENSRLDGWFGTSPVGSFPANGAGLHDMAGNVWEWTADPFRIRSLSKAAKSRNAKAREAGERVTKGGSFLCHRSYCYRYRIAARSGTAPDSAASHTGFRVFYDA